MLSEHWILTNVCATQADILTSTSSTPAYADASSYNGTLPYHKSTTSVRGLAPFIFGAGSLDQ